MTGRQFEQSSFRVGPPVCANWNIGPLFTCRRCRRFEDESIGSILHCRIVSEVMASRLSYGLMWRDELFGGCSFRVTGTGSRMSIRYIINLSLPPPQLKGPVYQHTCCAILIHIPVCSRRSERWLACRCHVTNNWLPCAIGG